MLKRVHIGCYYRLSHGFTQRGSISVLFLVSTKIAADTHRRHACTKCVDTCKSDPSVSDEGTCTPADKTRTQNREEMQFSECDKERREGMWRGKLAKRLASLTLYGAISLTYTHWFVSANVCLGTVSVSLPPCCSWLRKSVSIIRIDT